jgi:peptidoglycan/xylan/chitin deacetylase (PgdA/CDA1 family)
MNESGVLLRDTANKSSLTTSLSLKRCILLFAKYTGLFALSRQLTRGKTRVLAYHGIWLGDGHFGNYLFMSAEKFAARMSLLEKWDYPVVPFTGKPQENSKLSCPTAITIDDGWYSTWLAMLPALERHNYPATVYLTTYYCFNQAPVISVALSYCFSAIDTNKVQTLHLPEYGFGPVPVHSSKAQNDALTAVRDIVASLEHDAARQDFLKALCDATGVDHKALIAGRWFHLMNPDEVINAASRGISFEAHTHHHRITHQGKDSLADEIATNSAYIHKLTGRAPVHFCYPSGRFTADLWPVLKKCQVASATTTDIGLVGDTTPIYAMPRILDGQDVSDLEFEAEMCGFLELLRVARRAGKGKR